MVTNMAAADIALQEMPQKRDNHRQDRVEQAFRERKLQRGQRLSQFRSSEQTVSSQATNRPSLLADQSEASGFLAASHQLICLYAGHLQQHLRARNVNFLLLFPTV